MSPSLSQLGEFGLLQRLTDLLPALPKRRWPVGVGDDTSVLRLRSDHYQLFTHDLLFEGVHFPSPRPEDFFSLGWKSLAVNLSDIAAMGGVPQEAVIGLGVPARAKTADLENFYRGLSACGRQFHCPLVGGDTNRSPQGWVFSIAMTGFSPRIPLLRSGARVGDSLWVTGTLGAASLGWEARKKRKRGKLWKNFLRRHAMPEPRLTWGQRLRESGFLSAMLDISDGLAGDLLHLVERSRVGFEVDLSAVPREGHFERACISLGLKSAELILGGGEDYELLFTVRRGYQKSFEKWLGSQKIKATPIGFACEGRGLKFSENGKVLKKIPKGFRHF